MKKQPVLNFACQSMFLTLGQPNGFNTIQDYHRYAASVGFEGITAPVGTPAFDLKLATTSDGYLDDLEAELTSLGLPEGLHQVEWHVMTQNVSLHPSRVARFGFFVDGENFMSMETDTIQQVAVAKIKSLIDALQKRPAKQRKIVGFCGGRGYATAQAKWSAWPKHLYPWVIASLVNDWEGLLEYAADRGVTIHFEIGHPENDLLTGANFNLFRKMLSPKARKGLGLQADRSHFHNTRINAMPHFNLAAPIDADEDGPVLVTNHYKDGYVIDIGDGNASGYGGWINFSDASNSFATVGVMGSERALADFQAFNRAHHLVRDGVVPIVYEAECVVLQDPKFAMEIGAANCLALRDNTPLTRVEGYGPVNAESWLAETHQRAGVAPTLYGPGRKVIEIPAWNGGPFDTFAYSPVPAYKLLGLNPNAITNARTILERAGFADAAAA